MEIVSIPFVMESVDSIAPKDLTWRNGTRAWGIKGHPDLRIISRILNDQYRGWDDPKYYGRHLNLFTKDEFRDIMYTYRGIRFTAVNGIYDALPYIEDADLLRLIKDRIQYNWLDVTF